MPDSGCVLIVEDDAAVRDMLAEYLASHGYAVQQADDGTAMRTEIERNPPDVVLLDVRLPGEDGLTLARYLRERYDVGIIMVTAAGEVIDRVVGLEIGADDYLPKPFEPRELLARLRAILRRKSGTAPQDLKRYGRLEIDRAGRRVTIDGEERALTSYQFALLDALASHAGRVMSREALMDLTKGEQLEAFDRSVDVHVSRIRAAIEDDPKKPRRIITVRGAGYVFAKEQDRA